MIYKESEEKLLFGGYSYMMTTGIEFLDAEHEEMFNKLIERDNTRAGDEERKAFFYIISSTDELYAQINNIYDFNENKIVLNKYLNGELMLTGGTSRMLYLAHHLYNGFSFKKIDKEKEDYDKSILDVFAGLDENFYKVCINSLHIRFGRMK